MSCGSNTPQALSRAMVEEQVAERSRTSAGSKTGLDGDVLVFLPGAAEIRRAARACERFGLLVLPLHGDLPPAEQDRAVTPAGRRKVILSTNVAESSVTVEGVTAVIDSGLARVASDSPWDRAALALNIQRISQGIGNPARSAVAAAPRRAGSFVCIRRKISIAGRQRTRRRFCGASCRRSYFSCGP